MANVIKLKNASGSDPSASDLVVGEVAVRTDTAKLFTKKDDNSVAEIGVTALGNNDVTTSTIADDAVTYAKIQNVSATNRILGRDSSSAGVIEEITPANLRTMINVEDGATADQTAAEIKTLLNSNQLEAAQIAANAITSGKLPNSEVTFAKLQDVSQNRIAGRISSGSGVLQELTAANVRSIINVEDGATADQTASEIVSLLSDQNIATTGTLGSGDFTLTGTAPKITFTDSNDNPDYLVQVNGGTFLIHDATNGADKFKINSDGHIDITPNTDFAAGIDVTGNISVSGTVDGRDVAADGTKLDGIAASATNVTNTNQLTNGAGYITSADGGNAATLDSIDSSQFLRSDTADTASGELTITGGLNFGADAKCAAGVSSLSDGSTITVPFNSGVHHTVTLGGNRTFGDPGSTSGSIGQSGSIFIVQDGTGSRTASFHSDYKFAGGTAPTLSTAANAVDRLDYVIRASDNVHCVVTLDVK